MTGGGHYPWRFTTTNKQQQQQYTYFFLRERAEFGGKTMKISFNTKKNFTELVLAFTKDECIKLAKDFLTLADKPKEHFHFSKHGEWFEIDDVSIIQSEMTYEESNFTITGL